MSKTTLLMVGIVAAVSMLSAAKMISKLINKLSTYKVSQKK